jgi:hypothetical protein
MDVLSSLQMTKRTRNANNIHFYLQEKTQYKPIDLHKIQYDLTDYLKQDEDGDSLGVSDIGVKLSKIFRTFNILENLHKESFKRLLIYQFKLNGNITIIEDKVLPFLNKMIKIQKKIELNDKLNLFDEYLKMNPNEVSEIISKLYSNKDEEMIKMFEFWKTDDIDLNDEELEKLIKEEIKSPGIIEIYKLLKKIINKIF